MVYFSSFFKISPRFFKFVLFPHDFIVPCYVNVCLLSRCTRTSVRVNICLFARVGSFVSARSCRGTYSFYIQGRGLLYLNLNKIISRLLFIQQFLEKMRDFTKKSVKCKEKMLKCQKILYFYQIPLYNYRQMRRDSMKNQRTRKKMRYKPQKNVNNNSKKGTGKKWKNIF